MRSTMKDLSTVTMLHFEVVKRRKKGKGGQADSARISLPSMRREGRQQERRAVVVWREESLCEHADCASRPSE